MESIIILKNGRTEVKVRINSHEIHQDHVRAAFLLDNKTPFALYEDDVMLCPVSSVYKLGDQCENKIFKVKFVGGDNEEASTSEDEVDLAGE